MKRKDALEWIKIHTAKGNDDQALRVYVENRISFESFKEAVQIGQRQKEALQNANN